tara:strand:+ start:109443 stop:110183 length:741 start_codon:yes stop_codon:yes gene_type:complete
MKRNRHQSSNRSGLQTSQVLNDLTFGIAFIFIVAAVLLLIIVSTKAITKVPEYDALKVTVVWDTCLKGDRIPGYSKADVDTYIMGKFNTPNGEITDILGFNTPDRKTRYFVLDRDDKGYSGTEPVIGNSDGKEMAETNKEIITSALNHLTDGWYYINLHLYADKKELVTAGKICADVQVTVFKGLRGKERLVCNLEAAHDSAAQLTHKGQEITVCQFQIQHGNFVEGSQEEIVQQDIKQFSRPPGP